MNHVSIVVMATLILMIGTDCREREKPRKKWAETDGAIVQRPECSEPNYECEKDCYLRDASPACDRCCLDQSYVCDTGHKADFESCKGSK